MHPYSTPACATDSMPIHITQAALEARISVAVKQAHSKLKTCITEQEQRNAELEAERDAARADAKLWERKFYILFEKAYGTVEEEDVQELMLGIIAAADREE